MKFWRLLAHGEFRQAWGILARRPDTEHEQALVRSVITALVFIYLYCLLRKDGHVTPEEYQLIWVSAIYHLISLCLFILITFDPAKSVWRRVIGALGDLFLTGYGISVVGDAAGPLYVILLWVIFGNGFRYGRNYLLFSSAVGTVAFGIAIYCNAYWRERLVLAVGLQVGLVILPLYVSALLKKLTAAGKRAEEANKAKNRFLANMSHEMRTPLNGIIGLIDLLKETPLNTEQGEMISTVDASARTLLFLMQDLLDLSKIEAGKVTVQASDFDLHGLVRNTIAIMEPLARAKGLEVFLDVPPNVPYLLRGDQLLLRQVILNLLGNAVKFTERGEVGVRVSLEKDATTEATIRFEVADTGIGIPAEAQKRIFDRFAQADDSITRRYGGTGLGTTISKEIVEMMGGEIGVRSNPGQGSTFWFTVVMKKQGSGQGEGAAANALSERRALIVSADASIGEEVMGHLSAWGVRTAMVARSAQAFAQIVSAANSGIPFDFIIVAERGLDMDALGFARAIKSDPTIHHHQLVLVTDGTVEANEIMKRIYSATLAPPISKTLLFNALHFSRPELASRTPGVPHLADRHRQREGEERRLRVLVAEDNPTNQMVISKILERAGHEAILVNDGEQALEALKSRSFDITLMDLHMPVMGGIEAAKLYRFMNGNSSRMPIVALTADATQEARAECEEAGMEACLTKPIESRKLLELFNELVPKAGHSRKTAEENEHGNAVVAEGLKKGEDILCLDPKALQELIDLEGNTDFVARLAWTFLKGAKEKVRDMERAIDRNDVEGAREVAHALKGNSGQIGALALVRVCGHFSGISGPELERNGKTYLEEMKEEVSRIRVALDRFLEGRNAAVS